MQAVTKDSMLSPEGIKIVRLSFVLKRACAGAFLGVDPGQVHMGVAAIYLHTAYLYEITLESAQESVERIMLVTACMQLILSGLPSKFDSAVVEGAAYMAAYGQVPLETARTSAVIAAISHGIWPVTVVPPKVIREGVFKDGAVRAQDVWPEYPENAASALGCALYAQEVFTAKQ